MHDFSSMVLCLLDGKLWPFSRKALHMCTKHLTNFTLAGSLVWWFIKYLHVQCMYLCQGSTHSSRKWSAPTTTQPLLPPLKLHVHVHVFLSLLDSSHGEIHVSWNSSFNAAWLFFFCPSPTTTLIIAGITLHLLVIIYRLVPQPIWCRRS